MRLLQTMPVLKVIQGLRFVHSLQQNFPFYFLVLLALALVFLLSLVQFLPRNRFYNYYDI